MDDDSLRRGKPTNHRVYGEALALLAGDTLLAWAFEHAAKGCSAAGVLPGRLVRALGVFAEAIGPSGICGGQVLDTDPESREEDPDFVRRIAGTKTAVLIRSSLLTGAVLGGADGETEQRYSDYGTHLGMAFQIVDDILDVIGTSADLGKTAGKDAEQGKRTFVSVYGLDRARAMAEEESLRATDALRSRLPEGDLLLLLPEYLVHRTR
jgi:geranylgeranyl diphosphate synthase type II